ncbi:hypothetical protein [Metasolibacillus meyeri]|uniref:hypothetical protein n=1 Tax=Metasolibacillus meyeri TaxID=1071052 RepID=UPI000D31630E|nr:hypothetical protein [Metasolibacillus meyeri]
MANTKKMSIHRALTELKLLTKRIEEATKQVDVIVANRKSNSKINGMEIGEYTKQMQASYDKVQSLIQYRNRIKSLVVMSNAQTIVTIGDVTMTVAEAIERKQSINLEKKLVETMRKQYRHATEVVASENGVLPEKLETYLVNILGNKDKQTPEEVKLHTETFMKRNEFELIDPLHVKTKIDQLTAKIEEFESEVDAVLSESNATTFIEIVL